MLKQIKNYLLFSFLIFPFIINAQFLYGDGSDGNVTLSSSSFINEFYQITGVTSSNVTISYSSAPSLSSGDKILLIQMEGSTAGKYSFHEVTTSSASGGSATINIDSSKPITTSNFDLSGKLQLVTIPQYDNLTLSSGGTIFTNSYNHANGTGGVIVLMVDNTLTFDGGVINAERKGFVGGIGGAGAVGGLGGIGGAAGNSSNGYLGQDGGDNGVGGSGLNGGGDGGGLGQSGSPGVTAINPTCPGCGVVATNDSNLSGADIESLSLLLGGSGYGGDGGDSGAGAGAGGGGGSSVGSLGTNGSAGANGGDGGDGSNGGTGGGIVIILANSIQATSAGSSTSTIVNVSGGNSFPPSASQRNGKAGGTGGNGGNGGGTCSAEGPGGGGNGGNGGDGGGAGSGGAGGVVVYLNNNLGFTNFPNTFSFSGGSASVTTIGGIGGGPGVVGTANSGAPCGSGSGSGSAGSSITCSATDCLNYISQATAYSSIVTSQHDQYTSSNVVCDVVKINATDSYVECVETIAAVTNTYYSYFTNSAAATYSGDCINNYFNNSGATYTTVLCCGADCFTPMCTIAANTSSAGGGGGPGSSGSGGMDGGSTGFTGGSAPCGVTIDAVTTDCSDGFFVGQIFTTVSGAASITGYRINGTSNTSPYFMSPGSPGTYPFVVDYTCSGVAASDSGNFYVDDPCPGAVPITLIYFKAKKRNRSIALQWSTGQEINSKGFIVQKLINGQWTEIGFVDSKGDSNEVQEYDFIDSNLISKNYYRLKQIDFDGQFTYSEIAVVSYKEIEQHVILYPNPSEDVLNVRGVVPVECKIFNMNYSLVMESDDTNKIDISDLHSGIYIISIFTESGVINRKFVKK